MLRVLVFISAVLSVMLLSLIYNAMPNHATLSPAPIARAAIVRASAAPLAAVARLDLTVVTGDMIGHDEFPAYVPSDFTLPANSTVIISVTNFDDATALPKGSEQYAHVTGTLGAVAQVTP